MLIVNDEQLQRAGMLSLQERCPYCSKAFVQYPLIEHAMRAVTSRAGGSGWRFRPGCG